MCAVRESLTVGDDSGLVERLPLGQESAGHLLSKQHGEVLTNLELLRWDLDYSLCVPQSSQKLLEVID